MRFDGVMPKTMRAERFYADTKTVVLEDVPIPSPGPGEVLVKVAFCGICHSDLSLINGTFPPQRPVVIQGHEASGTIAELGTGVTGWSVGDRVIVPAGPALHRLPELPARRLRQLPAGADHGLRLRRRLGGVHRRHRDGPDPGARQRVTGTGGDPGRRGVHPVRRGGAHRQGRRRRIGRGVGRRRGRHPRRAVGPVGGRGPDHRPRHQPGGARPRLELGADYAFDSRDPDLEGSARRDHRRAWPRRRVRRGRPEGNLRARVGRRRGSAGGWSRSG